MAHAADAESLRQSYDEAFQEMYKDVGDLDKTFRFAELAAQVGDLEGAIAALERMLEWAARPLAITGLAYDEAGLVARVEGSEPAVRTQIETLRAATAVESAAAEAMATEAGG